MNGSHLLGNVYFPTVFSFTAPFALLPWGPAHILWIALTAASLIFASFLIWSLAADDAPIVSGALLGLLLATTVSLVVLGNSAGIAVGLCVVAVWCFLRERFVPAGILCLAVSMLVKPQDAGLVWLYFLLAGGAYRKRALQTLLATVALGLPGLLWVWQVAPNWPGELHANILAFSGPGGNMDPGLASKGVFGLGLRIDLRTVFSVFAENPVQSDVAVYLVSLPFLLVWAFVTLRSRTRLANRWLAMAAIAAFSMLPVYHRQDDARLLLLAVPACAMLWAAGGIVGKLALLLTTAGIVLTGDLPWTLMLVVIGAFHPSPAGWSGKILTALQVFPIPLILLAMGIFYLWVYARRATDKLHQPLGQESTTAG